MPDKKFTWPTQKGTFESPTLLNLNLNYEKLRRKDKDFSFPVNIHNPDFCIIEHQNLLSIVVKGYFCLPPGSITGDFPNIAETESVMLDALTCSTISVRPAEGVF